jgi:FkbM family methyltransferase
MELSASDWMERYALHTGAFYSGEVMATVMAELDPGDCLVDVGANIGFVTLAASRIVGPCGKVFAVEPNPILVTRLRRMLAHNQISNVMVLPFAAGDRTIDIGFSQDAHHGNNHIVMDSVAAPTIVPMRRLDDMVHGELPTCRKTLVKLDVEGAEIIALRGMPDLIQRPGMTFLIEVSDEHLRQNGGSTEGLLNMMYESGYAAFLPCFSPFSSRIRMRPVTGLSRKGKTYDVLFRRFTKVASPSVV